MCVCVCVCVCHTREITGIYCMVLMVKHEGSSFANPIHIRERNITMHVKRNSMRNSVGFIWLRIGTSAGPV